MIYVHVFAPVAVLARTGLFFLPDFIIGNVVHNTVFNTPSRTRYITVTGIVPHWIVALFPCAYVRNFETCSCLFSRLRAVILLHMTELLLYSLAYTAHLRYFNAFPRPLVRVIAYHAFQRLSKLFSCLC